MFDESEAFGDGQRMVVTMSDVRATKDDSDRRRGIMRLENLDEQSTSNNVIVDNYTHLSMIERAFRTNKTDLDIRPIYHRLFNRIEAHVCICFTAYAIMPDLERTLKAAKSSITLEWARFLAERVYGLNYVNPYNKQHKSVVLRTENDPETHELLKLLGKI